MLCENIVVKSKELKTVSNLTESCKESYGSKGAVPMTTGY
jgi:hypothetical protein